MGKPTNAIGLVGWWTFDGGDMFPNVRDRSGLGNHGNLSGQTSTSTVMGKIGQALRFDGVNDYVDAGDNGTLDFGTGDFTYSTWIKMDAVNQDTAYVFAKSIGAPGYNIYFAAGSSTIRPTISDGVLTSAKIFNDVEIGGWHHIAIVARRADAAGPYVYYDGALQSCTGDCVTDFTTIGSVSNSVVLTIGQRGVENPGNYFKGSLDDVRIYNRALSAAEVKGLYNSTQIKQGVAKSSGGLANGLVGHWTFDGKDMVQNVADISGQGNHGNLSGQTSTTSAQGKLGQGLKFDGTDDYVSIGGPASLTDLMPFSISVWAKPDSLYPGWQAMVGETNTQGFYINGPTLYYYDNGGFPSVQTISTSTWYHFVVTNDGVTKKLYIDGALDNSFEYGSFNSITINALGNNGVGNERFNGTLDDIRVYNRVLSAAEIKQLYAMGGETKQNSSSQNVAKGDLARGLVGLWSFDGKDFTDKVYDRSGSGFHGYFIGAATTTVKVQGKLGQAVNFDGTDDRINLPTFYWPGTGPVTVSFWNFVPGTPGGVPHSFGLTGQACATRFQAHVPWTDGVLYWDYGDCAGDGRISTEYSAYYGKWTHVVLESAGFGGNYKAIYLDGVLKNSSTASIASGQVAATGFDIGANYEGGSYKYHAGKMDDFRIYNRVLSASEIKQLYNMGR